MASSICRSILVYIHMHAVTCMYAFRVYLYVYVEINLLPFSDAILFRVVSLQACQTQLIYSHSSSTYLSSKGAKRSESMWGVSFGSVTFCSQKHSGKRQYRSSFVWYVQHWIAKMSRAALVSMLSYAKGKSYLPKVLFDASRKFDFDHYRQFGKFLHLSPSQNGGP